MCAGVGSIVANLASPPTDTVKTMLQTNLQRENEGLIKASRRLYKIHGIPGFYRGMTVTALGAFPYGGINFMCYDLFKDKL